VCQVKSGRNKIYQTILISYMIISSIITLYLSYYHIYHILSYILKNLLNPIVCPQFETNLANSRPQCSRLDSSPAPRPSTKKRFEVTAGAKLQQLTNDWVGQVNVWDTVDGRNPAPPKGWLKPYKWWNKPPINWCRISPSTVCLRSHCTSFVSPFFTEKKHPHWYRMSRAWTWWICV